MKIFALLALSVLSLAGCETPTPQMGMTPAPQAANTPAGPTHPVTTTRAVQLFDAICGASLVDEFSSAKSKMAANGIAIPSPKGTATVYSATEDVSFHIQKGPGFGNTCSMVWGTGDARSSVLASISAINPFMNSEIGMITRYRNQRRLVLFSGGDSRIGNTSYYNLKLLSDH